MIDRVSRGTEASVLRRLSTSGTPQSSMQEPHPAKQGILDRYGMNVIDSFEETLQMAMVTQMPWAEVREKIIENSPFLKNRRPGAFDGKGDALVWAERIVRTETMYAYNAASWETSRQAQETLGDVIRILCATFDDRTGADSYAVHGQIRRTNEPFEYWGGSKFMHPPNRSNDREIVVDHRMC